MTSCQCIKARIGNLPCLKLLSIIFTFDNTIIFDNSFNLILFCKLQTLHTKLIDKEVWRYYCNWYTLRHERSTFYLDKHIDIVYSNDKLPMHKSTDRQLTTMLNTSFNNIYIVYQCIKYNDK